ncbi:NRDE family protein [Roseomonas sp. OT10]|uniref:NRDE family protein n=1 Tax=Roseomonas cutis TaxID=2897332 RepID=UPI001E5AAEE0|nr:NRDE family protein [Roseomonas sp. OT10]UFN50664.1 NRDE family protein [Roseomonas sp. OT10]
MCTLVILRRPGHRWPLLAAANRDERLDRPWDPPGPWWPEEAPGVMGGRDRLAGGSWMALGPGGVLACVLNRPGSLGPAAGLRSRGVLPLLAAAAASAREGAGRIAALDAAAWRTFNMVVADAGEAFFLRGLAQPGPPEAMELPAGLTMVTAHDPNDLASPRIRRHLPRFRAAAAPQPDMEDWAAWTGLLLDEDHDPGVGVREALHVPPTGGFGTVSSSLVALGSRGERLWRFAATGDTFRPVALG